MSKETARMTDAQLGRDLRSGLESAKRMVQQEAAHMRSASALLAYLAGYMSGDAEVAALLEAAARLDFEKDALSAAPASSPVHA